MRINKCIELLEQGQPIYYIDGEGGYEEGKALAKTWADYVWYDMEHAPYDVTRLRAFMQGLVDGGPTPSGHRTPAVIVTLPVLGVDAETMKGGSWMVQQVLACGYSRRAPVPGGRSGGRAAVRAGGPLSTTQAGGRRNRRRAGGFGSHKFAARIGESRRSGTFDLADVWPLNSQGEMMLGIKIEDRHGRRTGRRRASKCQASRSLNGARDMGLSYGLLGGPGRSAVAESASGCRASESLPRARRPTYSFSTMCSPRMWHNELTRAS